MKLLAALTAVVAAVADAQCLCPSVYCGPGVLPELIPGTQGNCCGGTYRCPAENKNNRLAPQPEAPQPDCGRVACPYVQCAPYQEMREIPGTAGGCCGPEMECVDRVLLPPQATDCSRVPCPFVQCAPNQEMREIPGTAGGCCGAEMECVDRLIKGPQTDCSRVPCPFVQCAPNQEMREIPGTAGGCCGAEMECVDRIIKPQYPVQSRPQGGNNQPCLCPMQTCAPGQTLRLVPGTQGNCCGGDYTCVDQRQTFTAAPPRAMANANTVNTVNTNTMRPARGSSKARTCPRMSRRVSTQRCRGKAVTVGWKIKDSPGGPMKCVPVKGCNKKMNLPRGGFKRKSACMNVLRKCTASSGPMRP